MPTLLKVENVSQEMIHFFKSDNMEDDEGWMEQPTHCPGLLKHYSRKILTELICSAGQERTKGDNLGLELEVLILLLFFFFCCLSHAAVSKSLQLSKPCLPYPTAENNSKYLDVGWDTHFFGIQDFVYEVLQSTLFFFPDSQFPVQTQREQKGSERVKKEKKKKKNSNLSRSLKWTSSL